jgi:hypothetical protein
MIAMSDRSAFCDVVTRSVEPRSSHYFTIGVVDVVGTTFTPAAGPGTYTVVDPNTSDPPPKSAFASFVTVDATCTDPNGPDGMSGTVVLTKVNGGEYSGTFDIVFQGGDHVSGSFDSASCAALTQWGLGTMTCG